MAAKVFRWDWTEQPDLEGIAEIVCLFSDGRCIMRTVATGTQEYALVVADSYITEEDAQAEFDRVYYSD